MLAARAHTSIYHARCDIASATVSVRARGGVEFGSSAREPSPTFAVVGAGGFRWSMALPHQFHATTH
jgi:hypothetical protein